MVVLSQGTIYVWVAIYIVVEAGCCVAISYARMFLWFGTGGLIYWLWRWCVSFAFGSGLYVVFSRWYPTTSAMLLGLHWGMVTLIKVAEVDISCLQVCMVGGIMRLGFPEG